MGQACAKSRRSNLNRNEEIPKDMPVEGKWQQLATKLQTRTAVKQKAAVLLVLENILVMKNKKNAEKWENMVEKMTKMKKYQDMMKFNLNQSSSITNVLSVLISNMVKKNLENSSSVHDIKSNDTVENVFSKNFERKDAMSNLSLISKDNSASSLMDILGHGGEEPVSPSMMLSSSEEGYWYNDQGDQMKLFVNGFAVADNNDVEDDNIHKTRSAVSISGMKVMVNDEEISGYTNSTRCGVALRHQMQYPSRSDDDLMPRMTRLSSSRRRSSGVLTKKALRFIMTRQTIENNDVANLNAIVSILGDMNIIVEEELIEKYVLPCVTLHMDGMVEDDIDSQLEVLKRVCEEINVVVRGQRDIDIDSTVDTLQQNQVDSDSKHHQSLNSILNTIPISTPTEMQIKIAINSFLCQDNLSRPVSC